MPLGIFFNTGRDAYGILEDNLHITHVNSFVFLFFLHDGGG